jgi:hypothetical protein
MRIELIDIDIAVLKKIEDPDVVRVPPSLVIHTLGNSLFPVDHQMNRLRFTIARTTNSLPNTVRMTTLADVGSSYFMIPASLNSCC